VVERHLVGRGQRREVGVVGRHRGDVDLQLAAVGAEQQVVEAMPLLADQHQQARAAAAIVQLPVHAEAFGKRGHRGVHGLQRQAGVAVEMHAQEEAAAFLVAELLGVEDVAAVVEQQAGHAVDDAGTVGAGQGEDGIGAHRPV
jgi:hypothetical protein